MCICQMLGYELYAMHHILVEISPNKTQGKLAQLEYLQSNSEQSQRLEVVK